MNILKGVTGFMSSVVNQLVRSHGFWKYEPDKRIIRFGKKFYESAKQYGVTEDYVLDVYYHGYSMAEGKWLRSTMDTR